MSDIVKKLQDSLVEVNNSPLGYEMDLRVSLAKEIIAAMKEQNLTTIDLAGRCNITDKTIYKILHSNANCRLDTIGIILHALGLRLEFAPASK